MEPIGDFMLADCCEGACWCLTGRCIEFVDRCDPCLDDRDDLLSLMGGKGPDRIGVVVAMPLPDLFCVRYARNARIDSAHEIRAQAGCQ